MEEDKEESSKKKLRQGNPPATAASLFTDDLILEVLSRLPARSVCRFKCVSPSWRDLIADPAHRKKLPQTLAGFLYITFRSPGGGPAWSHHFASVSAGAAPFDPSLSFLQPNKYKYIDLEDTCNGLLLCARCNKEIPATDNDGFRYVVCNPATERWIELPPQPQAWENRHHTAVYLAFDPTVSSHFHVIGFVESILGEVSYCKGVDIFSSQTGAWIHRDSSLVEKIALPGGAMTGGMSVFFGGMLHLICELNPGNIDKEFVLLAVDMEGKAWKTIRLPDSSSGGTIGLSQGCLCYASTTHVDNSNKKNDVLEITLWCLENYDSKEWILKHSASIDEPLGITWLMGTLFTIHPDCSTVFSVPLGGTMLASYDLQHQKSVHILNLKNVNHLKCLPYVPLFSEALADADGQ